MTIENMETRNTIWMLITRIEVLESKVKDLESVRK